MTNRPPSVCASHRACDYATHKTDKVKAWLAAYPRYPVHFTPTSAFWLNLVERVFSTLSEKWIKRQAHTSVKDLEESIEYYLSTHNANRRPFRWHRKADHILASVGLAAEAARPKNMSVTCETPQKLRLASRVLSGFILQSA